MPAYKHYKNTKNPGQLCYVTSTCLDFAHLFARPEMRTRMCLSLLQDCHRWQASLRAFVVMSHHIHLVVRPEESRTIDHLMAEIKSNATERLSTFLNSHERDQMRMQSGLARRQFWKTSFRAFPLESDDIIDQKVTYTHFNPVRAGLAQVPEDYIWSSMHLYLGDGITEGGLVDLEKTREFYQQLLNQR